jgi:pyruvate formate lyase activating enzyme
MVAVMSLKEVLKTFAKEGELYEKLPDGKVRCYACGHRCAILPGLDGICRVRYNEGGTLYVPAGYVGALQCDPTEKKPFFHAYPGSLALTFGMLGCDYHCSYCTREDTLIATSTGPITIGQLFRQAQVVSERGGSAIATLPETQVYTHTGALQPVRRLFRHRYKGRMIRLVPCYLPHLDVTPEHEVFVAKVKEGRGVCEPSFVPAGQLTKDHWLAIPKKFAFSQPVVFDIAAILSAAVKPIHHRRALDRRFLTRVLSLSRRGVSSAEIGRRLGKSSSHIRHLRSKVARGEWDLNRLSIRPGRMILEGGLIRFAKEHAPGIPQHIPLDERLAQLLGYYVAEGCVVQHKNRVLSADLVFTFGHHELALAQKTQRLLRDIFGVEAALIQRPTTLGVDVGKTSVAQFFKQLCGSRAQHKRVPVELFNAPRPIVEAFLDAYIEGDGHRADNGKITATTISEELAHGIVWLALKTGRFPALRRYPMPRTRKIMGRQVHLAPVLFQFDWFADISKRKWVSEDNQYYYVRLRELKTYGFHGYVYNVEVDNDHSYLAQFVATHNCQNWVSSQALRDPRAVAPPMDVTPQTMIALARKHEAKLVVSSYNEPLITSEWAVEIFKEAKRQGFVTGYVSNGNATPEVLDYIRPWTELYKIDLKAFNDRNYRKLGGVLQNVLDTIKMVHERGFWLEIVSLLVPGYNDSDDEVRDMARFIASVSPDIPWHVTAFHKDYKMTDPDNTSPRTLIRAAEIGLSEGLRYVYAGNIPGHVGPFENTYCHNCHESLIERYGFRVLRNRIHQGACPKCQTPIPGRWE